jgi:hypothetical protein
MEKSIQQPFNVVYPKAKEAVARLGWTLEADNMGKGELEASTGTSLLSWGEQIEIKVTSINQSQTKVFVKSNVHSQIISWGKDDTNENEFIQTLLNLLER